MKLSFDSIDFVIGYNDNSAYVPERWAMESIAILRENVVIPKLIHTDFSDQVASFGDVVNTRKPQEFTAKRKVMTDPVTVQDATATNVRVTLDQHIHTSFMIYDEEASKSFKNLVDEYLTPAVIAQARALDRICLGQFHRFITNSAGKLGGLNNTNSKRTILDTRLVMNNNKVPVGPGMRNLIWTPFSETEALDTDIFLTADKVGDDGTALREASLGRKLGFDHYMCQNMSYVDGTVTDITTAAVNLSAGYAAGTTTLAIDGTPGLLQAGQWVTIAGDMQPYYLTGVTNSTTNTTSFTIDRGLKYAVTNDAAVTVYDTALVNLSGGYDVGYSKYIALDGFTSDRFAQIGQIMSFGTGANRRVYTVIDVQNASGTNQQVMLDRPLEVALINDQPAFSGPAGNYNFAFHRNAVALVIRPLILPTLGVNAAVISHDGWTMRATLSYNAEKQGHLVTLDFLCGVQMLDHDLGAVLLG